MTSGPMFSDGDPSFGTLITCKYVRQAQYGKQSNGKESNSCARDEKCGLGVLQIIPQLWDEN